MRTGGRKYWGTGGAGGGKGEKHEDVPEEKRRGKASGGEHGGETQDSSLSIRRGELAGQNAKKRYDLRAT